MSKREFLDRLCAGLRSIPDPEEIQGMVSFYDQAIDDRIEDGMTEEEAVGAMGDPEEIAAAAARSYRGDAGGAGGGRSGQRRDREDNGDEPSDAETEEHIERDGGEVSRVEIFDTSGDVSLMPSRDGRLHIYYTASALWRYRVEGTDTLKIIRTKNGPERQLDMDIFGHRFSIPAPNLEGIFKKCLHVRVLIPEGWGGSVLVNTASGDFSARGVGLGELTARVANGDMDIRGLRITGDLTLTTANGDVSGDDLTGENIAVSTANGDVELSCLSCGELSVNTASGDISLSQAAPGRLTLHSASGDIGAYLSGVCRSVNAETVSGDIGLKLTGHRDLYSVSARTTSGDVSIPDGSGLGPNMVRLKTLSGDLRVNYTDLL